MGISKKAYAFDALKRTIELGNVKYVSGSTTHNNTNKLNPSDETFQPPQDTTEDTPAAGIPRPTSPVGR